MMKQIPGYCGYSACDDGRIFSHKSGKFLKPTPNKKGYLRVQLSIDGKSTTHSVHTLVLVTFVGDRPDGYVARHLSGDKGNNALTNLAWGTPLENEEDKFIHGARVHGARHPKTHLKNEDVAAILAAHEAGGEHWNASALAEKYGMSKDGIRRIVRRKTWRHFDAAMSREQSQEKGGERG